MDWALFLVSSVKAFPKRRRNKAQPPRSESAVPNLLPEPDSPGEVSRGDSEIRRRDDSVGLNEDGPEHDRGANNRSCNTQPSDARLLRGCAENHVRRATSQPEAAPPFCHPELAEGTPYICGQRWGGGVALSPRTTSAHEKLEILRQAQNDSLEGCPSTTWERGFSVHPLSFESVCGALFQPELVSR